ncbi:hypothetical protein V9T40_005675 [Parthenolecanium corni]|uniref:Transmembrane protein 50A n=1 Tax=Parthenolecanium corni TaxID=536013 RepID=A0AAN9YAQ1_9HEMI
MASWCESINLTSCLWFAEGTERKRVFVSIVAGILFSIGWWLMIDADVKYADVVATYYIWGVLGTISLVMVNMVTNQHINGSTLYDGGLIRGNTARGWLFVGFVLGFASVFAAVWIYLRDFGPSDKDKVPGVEILLQNLLILVSSIIYKFCRPEDENAF